ncbi:MAG: exonuclease domain-containing protein, partial [Hydrogenophaga sp.]|nr:exonuclease domain-containing protein [Hydrogenophaga sp.]
MKLHNPTEHAVSAAPVAVPTLAKSDQNLVWIDCEMSGLDPEKERLLEIAVIITGP